MHLKVIACKALMRETCHFVARTDHVVDLEFFGYALHDEPAKMAAELQARIDACRGQGYDAIVLVAGLCGNGCVGVTARDVPLVLPRVDDCIVMLLGSRERYDTDHGAHPGTYYYIPGWLEAAEPDREMKAAFSLEARQAVYQQYVDKYGEDNAAYLMDTLYNWQKSYSRACLVDTGLATEPQLARYRRQAREIAATWGWRYEEMTGDTSLVRRLIEGLWPDKDFLVVPPGCSIAPAYDGSVVGATAPDG
jgi:hypothetical protein